MYVTKRNNEGGLQLFKVISEKGGAVRAVDIFRNQFSFSEEQIVDRFENSSVFETMYQGTIVKCYE